MIANLLLSLPFFAVVGCGLLAGRLRIVPGAGVAGLNAFVYYFALPALLFRAMALRDFSELMDASFLAAWLCAGLFLFALTALLARSLLGVNLGAAALFGLGAEFSNSGYLGIPLVSNLMGPAAAVPIALTIVVDLVILLPLTLALLEASSGSGQGWRRTAGTVVRGVALNPFVLSIALGVLVSWLRLTLPGPLDDLTVLLGSAAGPVALFAIGATLATRPMTRGITPVSLMVFGKLALHPLVVLVAVVFVFETRPDWALAAMLNAAVPTATNVFVLAERYGQQAEQVSTAILVSTVLAMLTFTLFSRLYGF